MADVLKSTITIKGSHVGIGTTSPISELSVYGDVEISGIVTSTGYYGPATNLNSLNASNITQGVVPEARLSGSYSGITSLGTLSQLMVSGIVTSTGYYGPATNLNSLNASNISQGTIPSARLTGSYTGITEIGTLTQLVLSGIVTAAGYYGPATNLNSLNASNISQGTIPSARLSGSYSGITSLGILSQLSLSGIITAAGYYGPATNLNSLNASNISQGTIPSARLSGSYSGVTSTGTLSQLIVSGLTTMASLSLSGVFYDSSTRTGTQVGIKSQVMMSTGIGVTWAPVKRSLVRDLMTAYTPTATGVDAGVFIIPQDPIDGMSTMNFLLKRVNIHVLTPSTGITTINVVKSTGTGAFLGTSILSSNFNLTGAAVYEGFSTSFTGFGATANSQDKLSVNFIGLSTVHQNFTVQVILQEA